MGVNIKLPKELKPAVSPVAKGLAGTGRHGGVLQKVAAGKMGHSQAPMTPIKSDRGNFKIKG